MLSSHTGQTATTLDLEHSVIAENSGWCKPDDAPSLVPHGTPPRPMGSTGQARGPGLHPGLGSGSMWRPERCEGKGYQGSEGKRPEAQELLGDGPDAVGHILRLRETKARLRSGCWGWSADYLGGVRVPKCLLSLPLLSSSLPMAGTGLVHQLHFSHKAHTHPCTEPCVHTCRFHSKGAPPNLSRGHAQSQSSGGSGRPSDG